MPVCVGRTVDDADFSCSSALGTGEDPMPASLPFLVTEPMPWLTTPSRDVDLGGDRSGAGDLSGAGDAVESAVATDDPTEGAAA